MKYWISLLMLTLVLSACGKKGALTPPEANNANNKTPINAQP